MSTICYLKYLNWVVGRTSDILVFGDPHYDRGHRAKVKYSYYIIHVYRAPIQYKDVILPV